jgi:hypothetical protein
VTVDDEGGLLVLAGEVVFADRTVQYPLISASARCWFRAIPCPAMALHLLPFEGDAYGRPTTIAGVLRVAQGSGRLPLVVFVPGSGGINAGADVWDRQFEAMGISTFTLDPICGTGDRQHSR